MFENFLQKVPQKKDALYVDHRKKQKKADSLVFRGSFSSFPDIRLYIALQPGLGLSRASVHRIAASAKSVDGRLIKITHKVVVVPTSH